MENVSLECCILRAASRVIVASLLNVLAPRQDGVCHCALNDEKRFKYPHMRTRKLNTIHPNIFRVLSL
jgi:hypothetical protein